MDKGTKNARFDRDTGTVIVDSIKADGSAGQMRLDLDAIEAITKALGSARSLPIPSAQPAEFTIKGLSAVPFAGELLLTLRVVSGWQGTFIFAAPDKSEDQVTEISNDLLRVFQRLAPSHRTH